MNLGALPVEMVEIIHKITPNEEEQKKLEEFKKSKKSTSSLPENDVFLYEVRLNIVYGVCMPLGHVGVVKSA